MTAYVVGGLVRVRVDNPDGADLTAGQVLTVESFGVDEVAGAYARLVPGGWAVTLGNLDPVATHDILHPEDDTMPLDAEEEDAWGDILDLDPALRELAATYAGTFDDIAARLDIDRPAPATGNPHTTTPGSAPVNGVGVQEAPRPYTPDDDDQYTVVSVDDNVLRLMFRYNEHDCPNHGTERAVVVQYPGGGVPLPVEMLPAFIAWLQSRVDKARRRAAGGDA